MQSCAQEADQDTCCGDHQCHGPDDKITVVQLTPGHAQSCRGEGPCLQQSPYSIACHAPVPQKVPPSSEAQRTYISLHVSRSRQPPMAAAVALESAAAECMHPLPSTHLQGPCGDSRQQRAPVCCSIVLPARQAGLQSRAAPRAQQVQAAGHSCEVRPCQAHVLAAVCMCSTCTQQAAGLRHQPSVCREGALPKCATNEAGH